MFNVIVNYDMSCAQLETLRDLLTFSKGGIFFSGVRIIFTRNENQIISIARHEKSVMFLMILYKVEN
jgi:hypothetical protein